MVTCPPELSDHGQKWAAIKGLSRRLNSVQQELATQEVVKGLKVLCEVRGTEDLASLGIFFSGMLWDTLEDVRTFYIRH